MAKKQEVKFSEKQLVKVQNIKRDIKEIKYIAYLNSVEISICNDEVNDVQQKLLAWFKNEFSITNDHDKEMRKFAQKAKEIHWY